MSKILTMEHRPLDWAAVPRDFTGDNNAEYGSNDATQRFVLGTRALQWDGSVYRYGRAGATFASYQELAHTEATGGAVSYEAPNAGSAAGEKVIRIAEASITLDQYAGGYLLLFHSTGDGRVYLIRGNSATSGTTAELYLDTPLAVAVTTSDAFELYANPWSTMSQADTDGTLAYMGIPQAILTDLYYGWFKTWGPVFISPQSTVGTTGITRTAYARKDGSIDVLAQQGANVTDQIVGYTLIGSASGDGPIVMLTISP